MKKKLAVLLVLCMVVTLAACSTQTKEKSANEKSDIYVGYTTDADQFIDVPNLRQYGDYTCGTTCVQMLMNYLYPQIGDKNLSTYEHDLGTTPENGTTPQQIYNYFKSQGVNVEKKENISIEELVSLIDAGDPVMMCIQAWSDKYNTTDPNASDHAYLADGHWVICVGYQKTNDGYQFYFNDPACVGYCLMSQSDLENRWIDMDESGTIYTRFGLVIKGASEFNNNGVFYLN
ncbi:C39 family peptidase [Acetobacterium wieringae]|uniref:Guanylyl cyclase n=1 Tax=Acetobacterium wieringae TaxID=52694 RepID=A0A1F2PC07_9FIRM|nr:C39 family peptidase [Acetobacterium wieringae]OFV68867.1 guanylyl cyclase [Acetobacterium wieringae]